MRNCVGLRSSCVCVCVCPLCVCVHARACVCKVSGRRHIKGFRRQVKNSFRYTEWRRLHIKNLVILICLHSLGLEDVKINYLMVVFLASNITGTVAIELDIMGSGRY